MSDNEPPNNRRSSHYEDDTENEVNHRIAIIVGVVVAFIFIVVMLFFLKYFAKYVQRRVLIRSSIERSEDGLRQSNEHRNSSPSDFSRSSLDNTSLPSNGIFLEPDLLILNESVLISQISPPVYQVPPNDNRLTDEADIVPPPSSTDDMRSIPTQNNTIPPPVSSDDVTHRQNSNDITFDEVQRNAYQNNRARNNMIDPPTSSGDPHFNDDLQRERLLIGPPPPYTPPGVQVPPQEAYTDTILAPSYEESLDHTVV